MPLNRCKSNITSDPREAGERPGGEVPTATMGHMMEQIQSRSLVMGALPQMIFS